MRQALMITGAYSHGPLIWSFSEELRLETNLENLIGKVEKRSVNRIEQLNLMIKFSGDLKVQFIYFLPIGHLNLPPRQTELIHIVIVNQHRPKIIAKDPQIKIDFLIKKFNFDFKL